MKIGLFFGSFNPIHIGHQVIAQYLLSFTELEQIWIIVSPHNPLKDAQSLIHAYDRLEMCKLAFEDEVNIQVKDIELHLPQPSYTIDTLTYLGEKYPQHQFSLIMGEDNLLNLPKWKNYELILRDYQIYVYPRINSSGSPFLSHPNVKLTQTPIMELSASFIRNAIRENKAINYFVDKKVLAFIASKNLYKL